MSEVHRAVSDAPEAGGQSHPLRGWNRYWFMPESPLNLGICRVVFFALLCGFYLPVRFTDFSNATETSAFWSPAWLIRVLERLLGHVHVGIIAPPTTMAALAAIWKISLIMACLGLLTRWTTFVAFVLGVYFIALVNNYGKIESQLVPPVFVLAILALSRCGDAFSIDGWLGRTKGRNRMLSGEYRWPVRTVWVLMAVMFFDAGIAKLRASGLDWAYGSGFRLLLIERFYDPNPPFLRWGLFAASHAWLATLIATGSLFVETCFPLALFNRVARVFFPAAALMMQLGIGLLMNIWFLHFLPAYVFWVPWNRVLRWVVPDQASPAAQSAIPIT